MNIQRDEEFGSTVLRVWKLGSISGVSLTAIGISAGYIDVGTKFAFPFISDHFNIFLLSIAIGLLFSFVGLIGWAKGLSNAATIGLAATVFAFPSLVGALGYSIAGTNIHGPAALVMYVVRPVATLLAVVLLIMAAMRKAL